jgi:periplasmic protein CpxP/Spy
MGLVIPRKKHKNKQQLMKVTKPMIIAALVAGNLLAWNPALRAADTNTPPAAKPANACPDGKQRPMGMMRGGPGLDQIAQQLNLTEDQKAKVKPILEERDKKMMEMRGGTGLSQEERRAKMQAIRQETVTQMKAVLTPEQFEKWQKIPPFGRGPRSGPPMGAQKPATTNAPVAPVKN